MAPTEPVRGARSQATRRRILDATVRCLVEAGYAGTSTTAVQEVAGVSRGALTHQFRSKSELFVRAVQHVSAAREAEIERAVAGSSHGGDRLRSLFRELYEAGFRHELFAATLELWTASRTDDTLHRRLLIEEAELGARHRAMLKRLLDDAQATHPRIDVALAAVLQQMRGAALTDLVRPTPAPVRDVVETCVRVFTATLES